LSAGDGARWLARTVSAGEGVVVPKPMNTVWGPLCESIRVAPPKYFEDKEGEEEPPGRGVSASVLSTSSARRAESMPVPMTATLPEANAEDAKAFTDSRDTGV